MCKNFLPFCRLSFHFVGDIVYSTKYFLKKKFFFIIYFWETVWAGEGQKERKAQNLKQTPGSELSAQSPMRGSNSQPSRSWPELNWLNHPSAPSTKYFLLIKFDWSMFSFVTSVFGVVSKKPLSNKQMFLYFRKIWWERDITMMRGSHLIKSWENERPRQGVFRIQCVSRQKERVLFTVPRICRDFTQRRGGDSGVITMGTVAEFTEAQYTE